MDFGQHKQFLFLNFCTNMVQNASLYPATSPSGTEPWHSHTIGNHNPDSSSSYLCKNHQNPISNTQIINIPFYWTSRKYGKNIDFLAFDWAPGTFNAHHCAKATAA